MTDSKQPDAKPNPAKVPHKRDDKHASKPHEKPPPDGEAIAELGDEVGGPA